MDIQATILVQGKRIKETYKKEKRIMIFAALTIAVALRYIYVAVSD